MYVVGWPRKNLAKIAHKSASLQCNSVKLSFFRTKKLIKGMVTCVA
jgi:hypothetical protein